MGIKINMKKFKFIYSFGEKPWVISSLIVLCFQSLMVAELFMEHNLDTLKDVSKDPKHISFLNSPK